MNYSIFRFTLNMHTHRSQASVSAFRGDTAVRLCITITDGGNSYFIGNGCTAVLSGTKADGNKLWNRCVIENNTTIRYDFTEQTTSCVGVVNCEITLYAADGNVITAPKFVIVVDEREVSGDDLLDSETERDALDAIFSSEASRAEAEEGRKAAEALRVEAELAREKRFEGAKFINSVEQTTTSSSGGGTNVWTMTFDDDSTSTLKVKNGTNGYTPKRGTDYWTEADKAEIKSYVDDAIIGGAW
jgi:hypothetical protein